MKNFETFISDLKELVSFNGVKQPATCGMPFGEQVQKTLECFDKIAKRMGFTTINHDNYLLEFSYGEGEEVGIIGHLDIVPAGDNWNTPPFILTEKGGAYYGRGVSDDKGPTLLALYALKEVIDSGVKFNKKIRFFAGTNEESGWEDIDYFTSRGGKFPEYGFSPDGDFPLSYAEKGIYPTEFIVNGFANFCFIKGGSAMNQVCDYATVKPYFVPNKNELDQFGLSFDGENIISHGIAAHGSTPEKGKNAIKPILEYMLFKGEKVKEILDCLFLDKEGLNQMVSEQGAVTLSPNLANEEDNKQVILCDVRVPYPFSCQDIKNKYDKFGIQYKIVEERHKPMCVDKNGWFVKALLGAYNEIMNENASPISMGGSTYARAFKFGCAFGAEFPNGISVAHKPNEFMTNEQMLKTYQIYKKAIENLVK